MSSINVVNILCKNPKDKFTSPFHFEIVFECLSELKHDIEWKLIYIGKADDKSFDQELESVLIGPLQIGQMKFDFEAEAPNPDKIPPSEITGITAVILTCLYQNQEFFRVGYYVNNSLPGEEEDLICENVDPSKLMRFVLSDKPRITKYNINWDSEVNDIPSMSSTNNINNTMFDGTYDPKKDIDEMKKNNDI